MEMGWAVQARRRQAALVAAERHQEQERAAAQERIRALAEDWDGPTAGGPIPRAGKWRATSAPFYQLPEQTPAQRRWARAAYTLVSILTVLLLAAGVGLAWTAH
jgi:hypothetical protein